MAGEAKYAHRLANHLDAPVDAACMVEQTGGTLAGPGAREPLRAGRTGWLAVGPHTFAVVGGDRWMGHPRGAPLAVVAYAAVANVRVETFRTVTRVDVELLDTGTLGFEVRRGAGRTPALEVLELLAQRCDRAGAERTFRGAVAPLVPARAGAQTHASC